MLGINTEREPVKGTFAERILMIVCAMMAGGQKGATAENEKPKFSVEWK